MTIRFDRIKEGDRLWDVRSHRMGNTTIRTKSVYRVRVDEVDTAKRRVLASWNGNTPRWHSAHEATQWRRSAPEWMARPFSRMEARYRCEHCGAASETRDSANHRDTCDHPKAVAWRKKNAR